MIGLRRGTVALYDNDRQWKRAAAAAAEKLYSVLGSTAVDIRHVGSTAIVHIKSKPIIDIAVGVRRLSDVYPFFGALDAAGFYHREKNDDEAQLFFVCGDMQTGVITHHIHIVIYGGRQWTDYLNFIRFMNTNPHEADEYEKLKLSLARRYKFDREAYTRGKAEYIERILRKTVAWAYLGQTVTVTVDRPVGSRHPDFPDMIYPINYGYLKGTTAPDGEEQDAYILGITVPVKEFTGKVIATVCREDDCEDKLVVAPRGMYPNQARVEEAVYFQEKYFKYKVNCIYQKSVGMIVYRVNEGLAEYLLLYQSRSHTWSFPKGHSERFETELQTDQREVFEEIGQHLTPEPGFRESLTYHLAPPSKKIIVLFLAESRGQSVIPEDVVTEYRWLRCDDAIKMFWNTRYKRILRDAERYIRAKHKL